MAALDELRAQVAASQAKAQEIGATVTEISTDLDDLITKLANGAPGSQEVIDATAEATALTTKLDEAAASLTAAAGKHTP